MPDILRTRNLQNRTDEFRSLTSVLRSRQAKSKSQQQQSTPPAPPRPSQSAHSQFSRQAIEIGLEIKQVAQELEQLALLARRKTLFDDRSTEIANLTNKVKGRIAGINTKITTLQRTSQSQPTKQRQLAEHNANVVMSLQSQLATTSTTFKDVLELRSQNLKASSDRRDQLMVPNKGPGFISSDSPLYRARPEVSDGRGENDDFVALSMPDMSDGQAQQMLLLEQQDAYLDSRSEAIKSVETTISELGQIFQQLARMVSEQREVVQRIDANVEDIDLNVQGAQRELLHYYSHISSNRWLILKVFAIILFAVLVFVLVM